MDLPGIFKPKKEETPEHFWSIALGKNWVDSAVWYVDGGKVQIVARGGAFPYPEGNLDSLVQAADDSLSSAATALDGEAEPSKVVFGLPSIWLEDGNIKPQYLEVLKKLSKELELIPAGFVITSDAILHFLKSQEGIPANVILVGISEESAEITLSQNGKNLGIAEVARSMSLGADLGEGLARFPQVPSYPTRILLYDHKSPDLEEAKQSLTNTDWEKHSLKFLHTPKVEIMAENTVIQAVSLAGGAEVGDATALQTQTIETGVEENIPTRSNVQEVNPEELGFYKGVDVAGRQALEEELVPQQQIPPMPPPPILNDSPQANSFPKPNPLSKLNLGPLKALFSRAGNRGGSKRTLALILGGAIVLLLVFAYWYLPRAEVIVYVSPQKLGKDINFTVKSGLSETDVAGKVIPGRTVEVSAVSDKRHDTTGNKTVGDAAKGQVTVYRVGTGVTLPKGTTLTSSSGLKFTLDTDVKVASGSAGLSSLGKNTTPAPVTATKIGSDYNLGAKTTFKVGSFSSDTITAENEAAFSGGSSKEVLAVSQEDKDTLTEEVQKDLESQAAQKAKSELKEGEVLIETPVNTKIDKQEFSAKLGEETPVISLSAAATIKFLVVGEGDIKKLVMAQIEKEVPEGFALKEDQIDVGVEGKEGEDEFKAKVTANLLPKVSPSEIAKKIAGKSLQDAKGYLSETPGYKKAEVSFKFKLPGSSGTLPHLKSHITVEVMAEK